MRKRYIWLAGVLGFLLWVVPARATTVVIVRTTNLSALQTLCALPTTCTVVEPIDGTLGQLFLVTTPLPLQTLLNLLSGVAGFVSAEVDQVLSLVGGFNVVPTPLDPTLMSANGDRTPVVYPAGSTTTAWSSYVNQPAAAVVEVQKAQSQFHVTGTGIVADIDTGVDPNNTVLQPWLLPGYDFTRNQAGASEMNDLAPGFSTPTCTATCPAPAKVNQSTAAVLDQSTAAVLDSSTNPYAAFGHGTMVLGVIHLVAPTTQLLPLKAFKSDGTGQLSDILRAIYYAVQQGNANVINMSFDTKTASAELKNALDYAQQLGLTSAASAGNDGMQEIVYPAALQNDVMGVASVGSTSTTDSTRSSYSNYGTSIVWVAAPGEQIVSTYPFNTYAAGWGTSFSAPFVSGGAALLHALGTAVTESESATALANAAALDPSLNLNHGRLDLVTALQSTFPIVTLSPSSLSFGTELLGTSSPQAAATLTNLGPGPLGITSIALEGGNSADFVVAHNCPLTPNTLAVGNNCVVSLTFVPTAPGPRKSSIAISDNESSGGALVLVTGVGSAISVSPSSLSFGSQQVGTPSAAQSIMVANASNAMATLWQIALLGPNAGDFSKSGTCGSALAPSASCQVNIMFTPSSQGSRSASLVISNDGGGSPQAVALGGIGTAPPAITVSTSFLSFGKQAVDTSSYPRAVTLTNEGDTPLSIDSITLVGADINDFAVTDTCGLILAPRTSCTIRARFKPHATGTRNALVVAHGQNVSAICQVRVRGTGIAPRPRLSQRKERLP